jgi:hypothetical protein
MYAATETLHVRLFASQSNHKAPPSLQLTPLSVLIHSFLLQNPPFVVCSERPCKTFYREIFILGIKKVQRNGFQWVTVQQTECVLADN